MFSGPQEHGTSNNHIIRALPRLGKDTTRRWCACVRCSIPDGIAPPPTTTQQAPFHTVVSSCWNLDKADHVTVLNPTVVAICSPVSELARFPSRSNQVSMVLRTLDRHITTWGQVTTCAQLRHLHVQTQVSIQQRQSQRSNIIELQLYF